VSEVRRICLAVAAVAASALAVGAEIASAAGTSAAKPKKPKPSVLRCHISMSTTPPEGSNTVDQPPSEGKQYGPASCPTKSFGHGVESDTFTVPDSGDTVGKYVQYFHNGSVTGTFDLTPNNDSGLSDQTFTSESWTGTVTVTGGTGAFTDIKGKKAGVMTCTSTDSVHLTCTEKVKVLIPLPKATLPKT
jgi:hypothetical protein